MDVDMAADLGRQAMIITLIVSMPAMLVGMVVGLIISLVQSVTSIQDQTLSFVPKILASLAIVIVGTPWLMTHLMEYTVQLYLSIPERF